MKLRYCVWFIAQKYLNTRHQAHAMSTMKSLCFWGILVATCALALVVSIMQGFQTATYTKMKSIYPDLIVDSGKKNIDEKAMIDFCKKQGVQLSAVSTVLYMPAFLMTDFTDDAPVMLQLIGVKPESYRLVSAIELKIKIDEDCRPLDILKGKKSIIIGKALAEKINVRIGDDVYLVFGNPYMQDITDISTYLISGILQTGLDDIDSSVVYIDYDVIQESLDPNFVLQTHIVLNRMEDEAHARCLLQQYSSSDVYSWKDLYPTLLSALLLEKWAMFFILLLIVFVASMNIVALLSMLIAYKRKDIMILLLHGMSFDEIELIFILISFLIAFRAMIVGLLCAVGIGLLLQQYPFIKLPDSLYDSDYLPVTLDVYNFFIIGLTTMIITFLASRYAVKNVRSMNMVELLKN